MESTIFKLRASNSYKISSTYPDTKISDGMSNRFLKSYYKYAFKKLQVQNLTLIDQCNYYQIPRILFNLMRKSFNNKKWYTLYKKAYAETKVRYIFT